MREKPTDKERLQHILDAISTIQLKPIEFWEDAIDNDQISYFGACKLIEIIGEAIFKLSNDFKKKYTQVPWEEIEGMRHIIVHDYYMISSTLLISVIKQDLEPLKIQIQDILQDFEKSSL